LLAVDLNLNRLQVERPRYDAESQWRLSSLIKEADWQCGV
jgi:hypothetical protein